MFIQTLLWGILLFSQMYRFKLESGSGHVQIILTGVAKCGPRTKAMQNHDTEAAGLKLAVMDKGFRSFI